MKSHNLSVAYQLLKKYQKDKNIGAYKVGGSNKESSNFFNNDNILLGAISAENIFYNKVPKNYPIAELEIIIKLKVTNAREYSYEIEAYHWGIECPYSPVENPTGDPFICICDNCSAGDLLIFDEISLKSFPVAKLFADSKLKSIGDLNKLVFPIEKIILKTIAIIKEHKLPFEKGPMYISSGGISKVFKLNKHENLRLVWDN